MAYNTGDVILVPFPYRDRLAEKTRPAVVLSSISFHQQGDVIVAAVTSQAPRFSTDLPLQDWQSAGLQFPSTVRMLIATMSTDRIVLKIGQLSAIDLEATRHRFQQVFQKLLSVTP